MLLPRINTHVPESVLVSSEGRVPFEMFMVLMRAVFTQDWGTLGYARVPLGYSTPRVP